MGLLKKKTQSPPADAQKKNAPLDGEKKKNAASEKSDKHVAAQRPSPAKALPPVFISPQVSEKSITKEAQGVYTFIVQSSATKIDVKNAMQAVYGVMPTKIRVINMEGKRQQRGRIHGKRADWKKAIVTLPKGKTISIHEGV